MLGDRIRPFHHWKDPGQEIYLGHFKIGRFDFSSINPFQLGSINGGSLVYACYGTGYYDLKIQNEMLRFKLPVAKEQVFFTEKHSYHTGLKLYGIGSGDNGQELRVLMYLPKGSPPKIYLIRKG
ncbi:hypothetical protein ACS5PU_02295 [Pedobacter sp. GSP4]|uniref:hypothetical protein n=1 Tax=Pedobacter sp. GSP4 TaxID=3453716 RepID=UPI003EF05B2E